MATEHLQTPPASARPDASLTPITELHDPRAIQILSTEHWSMLTARSLAYNEAFVRAGMFLTFLAMSFVGLALLAEAMTFGREFLMVAAIVLAFDLIVGLTTFERVSGANFDDLRAMHGIARIRHGYLQAAPPLLPYFSTAIHDDIDSVVSDYNTPEGYGVATFAYALSTSLGMVGLIVAMLGGVEIAVVARLLGVESDPGHLARRHRGRAHLRAAPRGDRPAHSAQPGATPGSLPRPAGAGDASADPLRRLPASDPSLVRTQVARRVQDQGERPVVHQLHVHRRAETAGCHAMPERAQALHEPIHQRRGDLRQRGIGEARSPAAPQVGVERELADHQEAAIHVGQRQVGAARRHPGSSGARRACRPCDRRARRRHRRRCPAAPPAPRPISPTTSPSTRTAARLTRWTTSRISARRW